MQYEAAQAKLNPKDRFTDFSKVVGQILGNQQSMAPNFHENGVVSFGESTKDVIGENFLKMSRIITRGGTLGLKNDEILKIIGENKCDLDTISVVLDKIEQAIDTETSGHKESSATSTLGDVSNVTKEEQSPSVAARW